MKTTTNILLTGQGETGMVEALRREVGQLASATLVSRMREGNIAEVWADPGFRADVLIHFLGGDAEKELETLARLAPGERPITLIVSDRGVVDVALMRLAMQAGARDFISGPQAVDDAVAALRKILKESWLRAAPTEHSLTAVVNAKGGAGASTIASTLAHAFATRQGKRVLLVDLDFQFGSQNLKLDMHPEHGLMEALEAIESLDEIALMGYVAKHASGLHVLSVLAGSDLILPGEVNLARLGRLIDLIQQCYEHTVVDLPRLIDPVFNLLVEKADRVIVVLQQDIASLRDAQRMIRIMTADLGVPAERICPLINRYLQYSAITLEDVQRTLGIGEVNVVPNDFKHVCSAANLGVPLGEHAPRSPVNASIRKLAEALTSKKAPDKPGMLRRLLTRLLPGA